MEKYLSWGLEGDLHTSNLCYYKLHPTSVVLVPPVPEPFWGSGVHPQAVLLLSVRGKKINVSSLFS